VTLGADKQQSENTRERSKYLVNVIAFRG
jgi:hypothetical protein